MKSLLSWIKRIEVRPERSRPKPVEEHRTPADRLDYLCYKHGCSYRIIRKTEGYIIALTMDDGLSIIHSGVQPTTALAVAALTQMLEDK